ncbi:hypothetical protein [Tomitella cavernea]|uniref:hypothetical protein n=1 Tax=Tomitella cavernea TaxID=1387982 RepID=UPI001907BA05|nr:hypothetical protein [Tomitella cavernea]
MVTVRTDDGEYLDIPLLQAIGMFQAFHQADRPRLAEPGDVLDDLPDRARSLALERAHHVREALYGDPSGTWRAGSDPRFDPTVTTRKERIAQKVGDLAQTPGYSRSSFYRMIGKFESGGVRSLAPHQPEGPRHDNPLIGLQDDSYQVILRVLTDLQRHGSTVHLQARINRIRRELDSHGIDDPRLTPYTLEMAVRFVSQEIGLTGTAKSRRSQGARAQRGYRRPPPSMPGERIEIDATQANIEVYCPHTGRRFRPWLSVAVCVVTRLMSIRLSPDKPSGRDTRLLLFDLMSPLVLPERSRPHSLTLGVPDVVAFNPALNIGTVVMDHGGEYENLRVIDALARCGATIEFARTRRGMDKPFVESANRTLDIMQQDLAGYVGRGAQHRGDGVTPELTLAGLQSIFQEWATTYYPYRPHSGLPSPTTPGRYLTPAQRYEQALVCGGDLHVAPHPDDVFAFLDSVVLTIASDGVHVGNFRYDAPILNTIRHGTLSPLSRPGRERRFYFDPYDRARLFFRDNHDGRWHVLHAIHDDGSTFPPFSELVADDLTRFLGRSRLTRGERASAGTAFRRFAEHEARTETVRWSRDRARVEASVNDPASTPGSIETTNVDPPSPPPVNVDTFATWDTGTANDDTEDLW